MDISPLKEQVDRYIDGALTLKELHRHLNESLVQELRSGEVDADKSELTDLLVRLFSEYELDRELLGNSEALAEFRLNLLSQTPPGRADCITQKASAYRNSLIK